MIGLRDDYLFSGKMCYTSSIEPKLKLNQIKKDNPIKLKKRDKYDYWEIFSNRVEIFYNISIKKPIFLDLFPNVIHSIVNSEYIIEECDLYDLDKYDYVVSCFDTILKY